MREGRPDELCPVLDLAPQPTSRNALAIEIYQQVKGSANQVSAERKNFFYIKPPDVEAMMRMRGIEVEERKVLFDRIRLLQDMENEMRPNRPQKRNVITRKR